MTALEAKILEALKSHAESMDSYDADRQKAADRCKEEAKALEANGQKGMWGSEGKLHEAKWELSFQKHGYDFLTGWKNIISVVMYGRIYEEWHSAHAGRYKGKGHGAYITSELTDAEAEIIDRVFNGLVKHGYLRLSKSGKMATFKG